MNPARPPVLLAALFSSWFLMMAPPALAQPREARKLLPAFDKDGDGRLNGEERRAAREQARRGRDGPGGGFGRRGRRENREPPQPGARVAVESARSYPDAKLYDPAVLRTFFLDFEDAGWEQELADFYRTDIEVPATLTVDGKRYPGVGVHFRGSSSFFTVGEGWKRSLNLALDHTDPEQRLHGHKTIELLNSHADPTFVRTLLYNHIARHHLPAPRVNHVKVVINGESWGVYVSKEPFNKDFLKEWFGTREGVRWKVPASVRGGKGFAYLGDDPREYERHYQLKTAGAEGAWPDLVRLVKTLNQTPPGELEAALAPLLDVDGALWFLAMENVLINDDGYWIRASDFNLYQDQGGRFHVLPHDANETFRLPGGPGFGRGVEVEGVKLDPLFGAEDPERPLLSRLLAVPSWRASYLAHVRTLVREWLDWGKLGPIVEKTQALIADEVNADTRKLDGYDRFRRGVSEDYEEDSFRGPRRSLSLKSFVEERRAYLLDHPELKKPAPRLTSLVHRPVRDGAAPAASPRPDEPVRVLAEIAGGAAEPPAGRVFLHYAAARHAPFQRLEMAKAEDGRWAASIPSLPAGTRVRYYAEAWSPPGDAVSFLPATAEFGALEYRVEGGREF